MQFRIRFATAQRKLCDSKNMGNSHLKNNRLTRRRAEESDRQVAMESDRQVEMSYHSDSSSKPLHPNGISIVEKIERPVELIGLQKSQNVIGIDFGTSTLAVCFVTSAKDEVYKFRIHDEDVDYYTPTALLIDQDKKAEIGSKALSRYINLAMVKDVNNSIFFDKVKLELQHNKVH